MAGWKPSRAVPVSLPDSASDPDLTVPVVPVAAPTRFDLGETRSPSPEADAGWRPTSAKLALRGPQPAASHAVDLPGPDTLSSHGERFPGAPSMGAATREQARLSGKDFSLTPSEGSTASVVDAFMRSLVPGWDYVRAGTHRAAKAEETGVDPGFGWGLARARSEGKFAQVEHPGVALGGNLAPMLIPQSKATGVAGALKRVLPQALYAALMQLGLSEKPTLGEKATEAAVTGATAGALGTAFEGGANVLRRAPEAARDLGISQGRRALAGNISPLSVEAPLSPEAVIAARKEGIIKPFRNAIDLDEATQAVKARLGADVGRVAEGLEQAGVEGSAPRDLAMRFDARGQQIGNMSAADSPRPGLFRREAENLWPVRKEKAAQAAIDAFPTPIQQAQVQAQKAVEAMDAQLAAQGVPPPMRQAMIQRAMQTFQPKIEAPPPMPAFTSPKATLPSGRLGFGQQLGMERDTQSLASDAYRSLDRDQTLRGLAQKEKAAIFNEDLNAQVGAQASKAPELAAEWPKVNARFGPIADVSNYTSAASARAQRRAWPGLTDVIAAAGTGSAAGAVGGPVKGAAVGLATLAGTSFLKNRLASTLSAAGFRTEQIARFMALPQPVQDVLLQRLAPTAAQSLARGYTEQPDQAPSDDMLLLAAQRRAAGR